MAEPSPSASATRVGAQYTSVSTRLMAAGGANTAITGFVLSGPGNTSVVLRALGPSLASAGLTNAVADPALALYDATGAVIGANDNWRAGQEADFTAGGPAAGLQPPDELEAGIAVSLPPGEYTLIVTGKNGTSGTAVAEVYVEEDARRSTLASISTRALVQTGEGNLISGLKIGAEHGNGSTAVVLRGLGPSLTVHGVANPLPDPVLNVYDANGMLVVANDDWTEDHSGQLQANNLAPASPFESAVRVTLRPGNYTISLSGKNNAIGIGLLEIYFPLAEPGK